jgi:hypothetical protein
MTQCENFTDKLKKLANFGLSIGLLKCANPPGRKQVAVIAADVPKIVKPLKHE